MKFEEPLQHILTDGIFTLEGLAVDFLQALEDLVNEPSRVLDACLEVLGGHESQLNFDFLIQLTWEAVVKVLP